MSLSGGRMSDEQFQILIETIHSLGNNKVDSSKSNGSFGNYNAKFYGQRDSDAVEEFIAGIEAYKEIEQISDKNALKGLPLLFKGTSTVWWKGVKHDAATWQDALKLLRDHFAPTRPNYEVYKQIFVGKQGDREPIDAFICQKRALFAKLPEDRHSDEVLLDFVYGLMHAKYKQQIPRHEIKSFRDLLEKGRNIERTNKHKW